MGEFIKSIDHDITAALAGLEFPAVVNCLEIDDLGDGSHLVEVDGFDDATLAAAYLLNLPDLNIKDRTEELLAFRRQLNAIRTQATGGASPEEIAAWPNKAERARRYLSGTASAADLDAIDIECNERALSETRDDLTTLQLVKEQGFSRIISIFDGKMKHAEDQTEDTSIGLSALRQNFQSMIEEIMITMEGF